MKTDTGERQSTGLEAHLGQDRLFLEAASVMSSTLDALRYAYSLLGDSLCSTCPRNKHGGG